MKIVEFIIIFVCLDALSLYLVPYKRPSTDFSGNCFTVTRGKKKKKRKALAKLALAGSLIKAKIELLLKILGAHLQIKFFAIALIGLLINIARFWIDVKRGGTPSKVSWRLPDEPNVFTLFTCSGTYTRFGGQTMFHYLYKWIFCTLFQSKIHVYHIWKLLLILSPVNTYVRRQTVVCRHSRSTLLSFPSTSLCLYAQTHYLLLHIVVYRYVTLDFVYICRRSLTVILSSAAVSRLQCSFKISFSISSRMIT